MTCQRQPHRSHPLEGATLCIRDVFLLLTSLKEHHTLGYWTRTTGNMEIVSEQENEPERTEPLPTIVRTEALSSARKKEKSFANQLIRLLKRETSHQHTAPPDNDADKMFLLSLLPKMKLKSASFFRFPN